MLIFSKRLKAARQEAALSQERLGILAGIDEMSASARMNQYEKGKHEPDFSMVERLAKVLNVPEAYFYAKDDDIASIAVQIHRINKDKKAQVLMRLKECLLEL
ncbi:helix-turn-helix domain-containing protein [Cellvibrio mixtus]|uniref:helix-turn-helix domain-containing protein n=1 Tax=Cellvibrio mixtus TaxID=39650 RepID=UPI0005875E6D|nr:helix-turn-helix transcriptional regulator [Cellvibrio mixtus]